MKEGKELLSKITDDIYSLLNYKDKNVSITLYVILTENNLSKLCKYILPTIPYEKSSKRFNYALQGYPNATVTFLCDVEIEEDYKIILVGDGINFQIEDIKRPYTKPKIDELITQ